MVHRVQSPRWGWPWSNYLQATPFATVGVPLAFQALTSWGKRSTALPSWRDSSYRPTLMLNIFYPQRATFVAPQQRKCYVKGSQTR